MSTPCCHRGRQQHLQLRANGKLISGAGHTLTYNLESKPLTITIASQTTTFVYDGDGGRVKKIAGTTTTRYISKLYECDNTSCSCMVFAASRIIRRAGSASSQATSSTRSSL